jgi:hypothetical protein
MFKTWLKELPGDVFAMVLGVVFAHALTQLLA